MILTNGKISRLSKMTNLSSDIAHKAQQSASLPSVEDWVKAGGVIQYPTHAPRQDKTMVAFNTRETK